jgi:hypothetical protein
MKCFQLNLKQAYLSNFVCPSFFFLSKACPKQNVLQIAIVTLLYWNKNIPNLIILMSMHFLPTQPLFVDLFSLCAFYWEYELFLETTPEYTPLDVMVIVVVTNRPSTSLP